MLRLSLIELARLSERQRAQLGVYGERWAQRRASTARGDRRAAETGVIEAYAAAGLPPPREIVWGGGPIAIAEAWVRGRDAAGDNVRPRVVDLPYRRAEWAVDRAVGLGVRTALASEPRLTRLPAYCTSIDEAVHHDAARLRAPLRRRLLALVTWPRDGAAMSFASASFSFATALPLGALQFFRDVCGLRAQTAALAGLWQVAEHAAWMIPHERVCWLAEKPDAIAQDLRGRLHAAKGPAVSYPDGWCAYAWKGVVVPAWIVERPERITVRSIAVAHDPQVRRCMIDIMTPERFINEGGAYRVARDETGILWRQRWRWEAWAAVEVVNGTPEEDGARKRYFLQVPANMRSPREAVAWTYGLSEQQYRPTLRT